MLPTEFKQQAQYHYENLYHHANVYLNINKEFYREMFVYKAAYGCSGGFESPHRRWVM
jgi:hypothetical protein